MGVASPSSFKPIGGQPLVVQSNGRPRSRSATAREERENGPVLNSPWWRGWCEVVGNDVEMFQVKQQRLHSRTKPRGQDEKGAVAGTADQALKTKHGEIALDLSAAAGPAAEERQGGDQGRQ